MKTLRLFLAVAVLAGSALATRAWTEAEFDRFHESFRPAWNPRPESLVHGPRRYNYLERIRLMADFVASYQVSDSMSPEYGGIIESEHQPNIIETDNTQEAIWVWSRWFELTGRDDYRVNIDRAWVYVLNHPAYWEHGGQPTSVWYAVWNCGLAFMAEARYRAAYGDSSYRSYADSCRGFYIANPLDTWNIRDNFVTSQSSGMAYPCALEFGDGELRDTTLARGARVRSWIEADAATRLAYASWAMSGGTALWGVCNTVCREDTAAGRAWVETYLDSLPGFYPTGTWNCSHNIWLANAYRACAEVSADSTGWLMHHYLVDTLLTRDTDRDGGIPATWTDPETQDQTWVSTYMDFMGMDVFVTPTFDHDIACLEFASPDPHGLYVVGDTVEVAVPVANVGLEDESNVDVYVTGPGYSEQATVPSAPFLHIDTLPFPGLSLQDTGTLRLDAITAATGDQNPLNDSVQCCFKVYGLWTVSGTLLDSASSNPVHAWVSIRIAGDSVVWDSCETNRSGEFELQVIDTTVTVSISTEPPYYDRSWDLNVPGDTSIALVTQPAHLMVVSTDPAAEYDEYYTSTLDTLQVTHFLWHRPAQGPPPWDLFPRLRTPTIVWFSGDADSATVPPEDRDSLWTLGQSGFNLLLTGQDIAEELAGTQLLEDLCGVDFDSSGWRQFFAFPDRSDSLGALLEPTATAGGNGAGNQDSRDMVSPLRNGAQPLMLYDTVDNVGAAIRRQDPVSGSKTVFLGFGFEAVNRPQSRPGFYSRVQLMQRFLDWFGIPTTGVEEPGSPRHPGPATISAWPNPFRTRLYLGLDLPVPHDRVAVLDVSGRKVAELLAKSGRVTWDAGSVSPGVYFVRCGPARARVVRLR